MKKTLLFVMFVCVGVLSLVLFTNYSLAGDKKPGEVCNIGADCGSDYICSKVEGSSDTKTYCVGTKGKPCSEDNQCQTGNCVYSQCRGENDQGEACTFDNDCDAPLVCKDKKCQPGTPSQAVDSKITCKKDSDCQSGEKCLGGSTEGTCTKVAKDYKCGEGEQFFWRCNKEPECAGDTCVCIHAVGETYAATRNGYCVLKKDINAGTYCQKNEDCNYGLVCADSAKKTDCLGDKGCYCQSIPNANKIGTKCSSDTMCAEGLVCRTATDTDVSSSSALSTTITKGETYCLQKLNLGHTCSSDNQCSTGQKCQQAYQSGFVSGSNVTFKEKTSSSKCDSGYEMETKTEGSKTVYACKTTAKQCTDPNNPVANAPQQLGTTSLDISATCGIDPGSRGIFTTGVSNQCLNCGQCTICDIMNVVTNFGRNATMLLAPIAALMIIISGLMYTTSGGNEERKGKAKKALGAAVFGVIIMLAGWLIINSVMSAVGAKNAGNWYKPSFTCPTDAWKWQGF